MAITQYFTIVKDVEYIALMNGFALGIATNVGSKRESNNQT